MRSYILSILYVATQLATIAHSQYRDEEDPWDLSFYKKGAAIGDSYAAGIGAGNQIKSGWFDWGTCSRYDGSYSNLVAQQLGNPNLDFTFTACSGAKIADIKKQAEKISSDQEFIILSAGGNDVNLLWLLDACIYKFLGFTDWAGLKCDSVLSNTRQIMASNDLRSSVTDLISAAKAKLAPGGKIYYVGYGKFFDTRDNTCDGVSWHVWWNFWHYEYLTMERRHQMNDLVDTLNKILKDAVTAAGDDVRFVDYDSYIDLVGGRYCQPGTDESGGKSANREFSFFYEIMSRDTPWFDLSDSNQVWHTKREIDDDIQESQSLSEEIGEMILWSIGNSTDAVAVLQDGNADNDLEAEVHSVEVDAGITRRQVVLTASASSLLSISASDDHTQQLMSASFKWTNTTQSSWHYQSFHYTAPSSLASSVPSLHKATLSTGAFTGEREASSGALSASTGSKSMNTRQFPSARPSSSISNRRYGSVSASLSRATPVASHSSRRATGSNASRLVGSTKRLASVTPNHSSSHGMSMHSRPRASGTARLSPPYPFPNATSSVNSTINGTDNVARINAILDGSTPIELGARLIMPSAFFANTTSNETSVGKVVSNTTHIMVASGRVVQKSLLRKLLVSDETARTFHPSQYGHAIIANVIMHQMSADRAKALHQTDEFPPIVSNGTGEGWLDPVGMACLGRGSNTWAARDSIETALMKFCEDPHHMRGQKGSLTSADYNPNSLDHVNISIAWDTTANLGEHACKSWMNAVTDGCDVPHAGEDNLKHGGLVKYNSRDVNATLNIQPMVMRREWDGGKRTTGQKCASDSHFYTSSSTLNGNIEAFCEAASKKSIANGGEVFWRPYNEGTPDEVNLDITWPKGPKSYQIFKDECIWYLGMANNGCDVPTGGSNPMNWKRGGTMQDNNGIQYRYNPVRRRKLAPSKPTAKCSAPWSAGYSITVRGSGFSSSDFGQGTLLPSMNRCGSTSGWTFKYASDLEEEWEFEATLGMTTFIKKGCVGDAIGWAGGPNMQC